MSEGNDWDPDDYDDGHDFVHEYGRDLLDLLDPRLGERVLDVGCGTGHLTAAVADRGAEAVGIDAAAGMVEHARAAHDGPTFVHTDARTYEPDGTFDAVLSNAALHWIPEGDHDAVLDTVTEALGDGGRFVAELGGRGNVARVTDALAAELTERGYDPTHPWYFPSVGEYAPRLEAHGFEVRSAWLFDRPTDLDPGPDGLREWVGMFGDEFFAGVDDDERAAVLDGVEDRLRAALYDAETETWTVDYRRLRFVAVR